MFPIVWPRRRAETQGLQELSVLHPSSVGQVPASTSAIRAIDGP